jgi:hypothetical protein
MCVVAVHGWDYYRPRTYDGVSAAGPGGLGIHLGHSTYVIAGLVIWLFVFS